MPDDGHRYELIDGSLIATPALSQRHQPAIVGLTVVLHRARPNSIKVLVPPFDVALGTDTVTQPELLVARRSDFTERDLPTAPLLAGEVLSPNTRHVDLELKRARYETRAARRTGQSSAYVQVADVVGDERYTATMPYAVCVCPADLRG